MSTHAPVSIVIANWNGGEWLEGCLQSIRNLRRPPEACLIVDNGSEDHSKAVVEKFPEVRWLPLHKNTGFCHANNVGFQQTTSEFVLALNPDTKLEPEFLEEQLRVFREREHVGATAGKLLRFDGKTLDTAGQQLSRSRQPIDRGYGKLDRGAFDEPEYVFSVCGAAALYRRRMLEAIQLSPGEFFDERFFAFYEDLDLCWRANRAGWKVFYVPTAVGFHARGATAQPGGNLARWTATWKRSPEVRFHVIKNRWLSQLRNDKISAWIRDFPWIAARDFALLSIAAIRSPSVLLRLWNSRAMFRRVAQETTP